MFALAAAPPLLLPSANEIRALAAVPIGSSALLPLAAETWPPQPCLVAVAVSLFCRRFSHRDLRPRGNYDCMDLLPSSYLRLLYIGHPFGRFFDI